MWGAVKYLPSGRGTGGGCRLRGAKALEALPSSSACTRHASAGLDVGNEKQPPSSGLGAQQLSREGQGVAGLKLSQVLTCSPRTFNYILRELPKVPTHVPVCVLGNYRDMGEHRVILPDDVRDFIDNLDRWVQWPCSRGTLRGAPVCGGGC